NSVGLAPKTSSMAVWFAPPPIQLPPIVAHPLHTSSAPVPPTTSGAKRDTVTTAKGPPKIIPTVPVRNITNAFGPNFNIALKSRLSVNRTREAGNKYLEAIRYNPECSPETNPNELSKPGIK